MGIGVFGLSLLQSIYICSQGIIHLLESCFIPFIWNFLSNSGYKMRCIRCFILFFRFCYLAELKSTYKRLVFNVLYVFDRKILHNWPTATTTTTDLAAFVQINIMRKIWRMEKKAKERTDVLCLDEFVRPKHGTTNLFIIVFHVFGCFGLCFGPEGCLLRSVPFAHLHQVNNNEGEMAISNGVSIEYRRKKIQ